METMMLKTKLAGSQTHLANVISAVLDETRQKMKLAAEEEKAEKGGDEKSEKVKKLLKFEKKEHGHIPSEKEEKEEYEKKSSALIDSSDPEEVEKLAAALDEMAEKLADVQEHGTESKQGGETLVVQSPASGTQKYPKPGKQTIATKPASDGKPSDSTGAGDVVGTDDKNRVGGSMPAKGVLKTGSVALLQNVLASQTGVEKVAKEEKSDGKAGRVAKSALTSMLPFGGAYQGYQIGKNEEELALKQKRKAKYGPGGAFLGSGVMNAMAGGAGQAIGHAAGGSKGALIGNLAARGTFGGLAGAKRHEQEKELKGKKKQSSAIDYILAKVAAGADMGGESHQGGETLPSNLKPAMQPGRSLIQNAQNLKNVTKPEAKAARKAELAEVLSEPASKRGVADEINGNLRSASKGGVKIAAAKALLAKIASEGCTCDGAGSCRCCKMKKTAAEMRAVESNATA